MQDASESSDRLIAVVGRSNVLLPGDDREPCTVDWRGRYRGEALAVVRPGSSAEVAEVVRLSVAARVPVVPQSGNTGLRGAAIPSGTTPGVVLCLDRMSRIRAVGPLANTITVGASCVLADIQAAAAAADRLFPLSLGAEGSCRIGGTIGTIGTNAGGTAVLRDGPTREPVPGIEAGLPDGRVFNGLRALRKDDTGYDLKRLFIGAEGTLGIVTAAVLTLFARPRTSAPALTKLDCVEQAIALMGLLRGEVGDLMRAIKGVRDSSGLMNPGKVLTSAAVPSRS